MNLSSSPRCSQQRILLFHSLPRPETSTKCRHFRTQKMGVGTPLRNVRNATNLGDPLRSGCKPSESLETDIHPQIPDVRNATELRVSISLRLEILEIDEEWVSSSLRLWLFENTMESKVSSLLRCGSRARAIHFAQACDLRIRRGSEIHFVQLVDPRNRWRLDTQPPQLPGVRNATGLKTPNPPG